MAEIIITIIAIAVSATYVGYLSYSIHAAPLWIIVIATFGLMIREFIVEFGSAQTTGPGGDVRARRTD